MWLPFPLRRERRSAFPTPVLACSDVMSGQDAPPTSVTRLIHIVLLWSTEIGTYRRSIDISLLWSETGFCHPSGALGHLFIRIFRSKTPSFMAGIQNGKPRKLVKKG